MPGKKDLLRKKRGQAAKKVIKEENAKDDLIAMKSQLAAFKSNLETFASAHRKDIKSNPHFRKNFQQMCDLVGVDCLASKKGFWSELLGIGDFYYDLSVQVVECCLKTRAKNGGLININELQRLIKEMRGPNLPEVTCDDIVKSIDKLTELGRGFQTHAFGDSMMVQSVPTEFNQDHSAILGQAAASNGKVTAPGMVVSMGWVEERAVTVLEQLVKDGMAWVDDQDPSGVREYWLPGLIER